MSWDNKDRMLASIAKELKALVNLKIYTLLSEKSEKSGNRIKAEYKGHDAKDIQEMVDTDYKDWKTALEQIAYGSDSENKPENQIKKRTQKAQETQNKEVQT